MKPFIGKKCIIDRTAMVGYQADGEKHGYQALSLGDNAVIRSGSVLYHGAVIGEKFQTGHNVVIREKNNIGADVGIGVNTYLGPGNQIGDNVRIHTNCFIESATIEGGVAIAPNVILTNDLHPRCPSYLECVGGVTLKKDCVIGANTTILPGVVVGENAIVGAGSVVTKDVPSNAVVAGNPAKHIKDKQDLKCIVGIYEKPYEWK